MNENFIIKDGVLTDFYRGSETKVVIPEGVVKIGLDHAYRGVFEDCSITEVVMPDSVIEISSNAFEKCGKLKSISFSSNLERIGSCAFLRCKALKEVKLPSTLKELGDGCFAGCGKLTCITCESDVIEMDGNPFVYDKAKIPLGIADEDGFIVFGGTLFAYVGQSDIIKVPEGVTRIADSVFEENLADSFFKENRVEEVILPESVKYIGEGAFKWKTGLKTITMPDNIEVGRDAFYGCNELVDDSGFFVHDGVAYVYSGDSATVNVPEGTKVIADGLFFHNRYSIQEVILPEGLEVIGDSAFSGCCLNILEIPDTVNQIGERAFEDCKNLKKLEIPDGVEEIGYGAFKSCSLLEEISLPKSIRTIGGLAFEDCKNLKKLEIPDDVEEIGYGAFEGCSLLEEVSIPRSVRTIGSKSFKDCVHLKKIEIPDGVEEIDYGTFENCSLLEEVSIPKSVRTIGSDAFKDCVHLNKLDITDVVEDIGCGAFKGCINLADENGFVIFNNTIWGFYSNEKNVEVPEDIVAIDSGVFSDTGIESIKLPSTLRKIGRSAFCGCDLLEEITIPEGVTEISDDIFKNCKSLKKVILPSTLKTIGSYAFDNCSTLEGIIIPEGVSEIESGAFSNCFMLEEITIPEGVTEISHDIFIECKSLKKVILPSTLKTIGSRAFDNCSTLEGIIIPEGVTEITRGFYGGTFEECKSLKKVVLPSTLERIDRGAFQGCKMLEQVIVPANVKKSVFSDCPELKDKISIEICPKPKDKKSIEICPKPKDKKSIEVCSEIKDNDEFTIENNILYHYSGEGGEVVVPEGVVEIADDVFREGRMYYKEYRKEGSLKKISLPSSLKKIGERAFWGCNKLKNITFSSELESIGSFAFYGCEALKSLYIPSKVKSIDVEMFRGCNALKEIAVDEGNDTYSSMDGILMNKAGDSILFVPAGKKLSEYVVPSTVKSIGYHAFIDCRALKKIVIPTSVKDVGSEVFPRNKCRSKSKLREIEVEPGAGSGTVGDEVFDIYDDDNPKPIVYPKLPVTFVKERNVQVCLALGFCLNPDKYEGVYAELYEKYAASHEKTITKKAVSLKIKGIKEYYEAVKKNTSAKSKSKGKDEATTVIEEVLDNSYKPDLTIKKPSELVKVEILEEAVQKGTLKDVTDVLETYKTFEFTARALGLAARYRGVDFVEVLVEHGASFDYRVEAALVRKYKMIQSTVSSSYWTLYYLMLVPKKLRSYYWNSAMYGVGNMDISSDLVTLSLDKRIEVVKYLADNKNTGVSLDEMLFWALTTDEIEFADALIEMGVNLQETPPFYYTYCGLTYLDIITSAPRSEYWNDYVKRIAWLKKSRLLPVLERFGKLASTAGKQLALSQKMFDGVDWSGPALSCFFKYADISKIKHKKALEMAVSTKAIGALEIMAEAGWLNNTKIREELIDFARDNKHTGVLAWLMNYKNKAVDVAKEESKEVAKMIKGLTEDPNSVSALKKKWSYVKLEDGTLQITSYKGDEEDVVVPSVIGKATVTSIGKEAFSVGKSRIKNKDSRRKIKTVSIPDGVTKIEDRAFEDCKAIERIVLPNTVKEIGDGAFCGCESLKDVYIPDTLEIIGHGAFSYCKAIEKIVLPNTIKEIGDTVFYGCESLKDVYIPATLEIIGRDVFGGKNGNNRAEGICVHTPAGSAAELYMKWYNRTSVSNDYA